MNERRDEVVDHGPDWPNGNEEADKETVDLEPVEETSDLSHIGTMDFLGMYMEEYGRRDLLTAAEEVASRAVVITSLKLLIVPAV